MAFLGFIHRIGGFAASLMLKPSHNNLSSFTALDPLRFLKSPRVLDISYNEIGAHTVDTRRHLCSSPLSHTLDYDKKFEEVANGDETVVNFWEAYSIFGGLNITQLDIMGNAAAVYVMCVLS
ncbi:hypothetical protein HanHA300_Chr08g0289931 [Helianthus annuus]|nr:hypothetical protein HanHA300_Chr08g0289931 [Helianthus annuus]